MEEKYYIKISPESIKGDVITKMYSGNTFGVYSGMSEILSGGTNGSSLLTGLTIPIVFSQTYENLGFYTPFDGFILQKDVVTNFITTGDPNNQYAIRLSNTSDQYKGFLKLSNYTVDWGDGNTEPLTSNAPQYLTHIYPSNSSSYTITLTQNNPWGQTIVKKKVYVPTTGVTINNPDGDITFVPQGGNWSGIPISYQYIFTGDSSNTVQSQTSNNYTNVPFIVSGFTSSRLNELKLYGNNPFDTTVTVSKGGQPYGKVDVINADYTSYTINDITYYDYPNGTTYYIMNSSGLTSNDLVASGITKEEVLINVVDSPEIQSEIFIERGKLSGFESLQRLGEVDNMGDLTSYGYGYFKINKQKE
jgi:hypothetical protein